MKKTLSTVLAVSMLTAFVPAFGTRAASDETAPYRTVRWEETTLVDSQMQGTGWDYKNENFMTNYDPTDFSTGAKGLTSDGEKINYASAVSGLFGKADSDTSVRMHMDNAIPVSTSDSNNKEVYQMRYAFNNFHTGQKTNPLAIAGSNGGYSRLSFDFAFDETVSSIVFQANNVEAGNTKNILEINRTGLSFMGVKNVTYDKPLQSEKWYHAEIVLRNGTAEDDLAHKGWVYIDGKFITESDFTWTDNGGTNRQIKKLCQYYLCFMNNETATPKITNERNGYFDNMFFEYWNAVPQNAPIRSGNVDLSTSLSSIEARETGGAYAGIDQSITVAQYKESLNNKNLTVVVRDKNGNTVDDSASLVGNGNVIALTDTDNVTYYKKVYTDRVIFENTFDDSKLNLYGAPTGGLWGINQFNLPDYPALTTSTEASIGGKSSDDKSYLVGINNYVGGGDGSGKFFQLVPLNPISAALNGNKIVFEMSVFCTDANINRVLTVSTNSGSVSIATYAGNASKFRVLKADTGASSVNYDINKSMLNAWHTYKIVFTQGGNDVLVYIDDDKIEYSGDKAFSLPFTGISKIRNTYGVNSATSDNPLISNSYTDDIVLYETADNISEVAPTATPTVEPTATPTVEPTATPTVEPTATPTVEPTATPTVAPTATPTVAPTATPIPEASVESSFKKKLDNEDIPLENISIGEITMQTDIDNKTDRDISVMTALAEFDGDSMIKVTSKSIDIPSGVSQTIEIADNIEANNINKKLIGYVWDLSSGMTPMCEKAVLNGTKYNQVYGDEIIQDVLSKTVSEPHPRIWADGSSTFNNIKSSVVSDEDIALCNTSLISDADDILSEDLCSYDDDDWRRIKSSGEVNRRLITLSYAYRMTDSEAYFNRALAEIENVISWDNWNVNMEALDTSAICTGLSIAYDWMYDAFTADERKAIEDAVYNKAIAILLRYYPNKGIGWMAGNNNWAFVCNGGFALTALTFCDKTDYREQYSDILDYSFECMHNALDCIENDGAWAEGIGYWSYAMKYYSMCMKAFESAAGKTYGYLDLEGIKNTGMYALNMTGYKNQFNYNDCSAAVCSAECLLFFADTYKNKDMYDFRVNQLKLGWDTPTVFDMMSKGDSSQYNEVETGDFLYERGIDIAGFKSGGNALTFEEKSDSNRLQSAAVIHGGINAVNHGHIDAGSFMYEAMGVRWAIDIGADNYNLHNCTFSDNVEKSRWSYYKMRGEAHNTVIINPGLLADQNLTAEAPITKYESNGNYGFATVDMSGVLEIPSASRGIRLDKETGSLLVQDEFTLAESSTLYWFLNTDSPIESVSDDKKTVVLKRNGKRLCIRLLSNEAEFETMVPSQILSTSPNPDLWDENINSDNEANPKTQQVYGNKVYIRLENAVGDKQLAVYMSPIEDNTANMPNEPIPAVTPISEWR